MGNFEDQFKNWQVMAGLWGIMLLILICPVVFYVWRTILGSISDPQIFEVKNRKWERSVRVFEFRKVERENWEDLVPKTAQVISKSQKIRSNKQVPDGFKEETEYYSTYAGTGEKRELTTKSRIVRKPKYRDEPVYDTYCRYGIDDWDQIDHLTSSGTHENLAWPKFQLPAESTGKIGDRKVEGHFERFQVELQSQKTKTSFLLSDIDGKKFQEDTFSLFPIGKTYQGTTNGLGEVQTLTIGSQTVSIYGVKGRIP